VANRAAPQIVYGCLHSPSRRYERRRPEKIPLHKIISQNFESWLAWREAAGRPIPGYVEEEFRGYLTCGLLCFGFTRAVCITCRTGFVVAFSCKGRGVCPSCNGRHMAQTAAHLADHVIPPVPVRQWVISVPKRLRGFLADRHRAVAAVTRIFLDEIERTLIMASGVTAAADTPSASRPRLGGISFLHRFGSALNQSPLRAAQAQSRELGRAGSRAEVHAAGSNWRRRAHAAPSSSTTSPISSRRRGSTGIVITGCLRRITGSGGPSRHWRSGISASGARPRPAGMAAAVTPRKAAATRIRIKSPVRMTLPGQAWAKLMARVGEEFPLECPACGGDIRLIAFRLLF